MTQADRKSNYFLLDPISGWQASSIDKLSPINGTGLAVDCVPGQPQKFAEALAHQLDYPIALACDSGRKNLYLLDQGVNRIKIFNFEKQNEFALVAGLGGKGRGARQLRSARGLAILPDGSLVIADTGNHQVKIFSAFPHALLAVWGTGKPGNDLNQFHWPWKVVGNPCGLLYIVDRGNGRIQRIHRDGRAEGSIGGFQDPSGLALHTDGTLAILDGTNVQIFAAGRTTPAQKPLSVPNAASLAFDGNGYLYVGTSTALVYKFVPTGSGCYSDKALIGVTGMEAQFLDLLWTEKDQLLGILLEKCMPRPVLRSLSTCGSYLPSGTLTTETLDSGIEACSWHRIELNASVPQGMTIKIATQTAETDIWSSPSSSSEDKATPSWDTAPSLKLIGDNPDCLVQSPPGRYLRIQITLETNKLTSPVLRAIRVYFPRESYLQYLPATYQEDDESRVFLDRFLSIFQTTFDGIDRRIDDMWMLFDPASVPDKWYPWLAAWLALPINPVWSNQQRRVALKKAGKLYPQRGTPAGIQELIKEYSGIDARLVEHFRLRQLMILTDQPAATKLPVPYTPVLGSTALCAGGRLWSRDYYQRLQVGVYSRIGYFRLTGEPEPGIEPLAWGANEFSVFFNCEPYQVNETRQKVAQVVEREKPAHTRANYCPVLPRMRIGVQSTLGIDTRIGMITPLLLGTTGSLGYDSILGCSAAELYVQSQNAALRPQVNVNSRLL